MRVPEMRAPATKRRPRSSRTRRSGPTSSPRRSTCTRATAAWCRRSPRATTCRRSAAVVDEALEQAGIDLDEIDAVAVTNGPGLVGSLLVGVCAAKTLAFACGLPLARVNHIEAHIFAAFLADGAVRPGGRAGGQRRPYRCTTLAVRDRLRVARPDRRRRGRRGVRQGAPASCGCATPAARRSSGRPVTGDPGRVPVPARACRRGAPRLQLQRPEDGRPLACGPGTGRRPRARGGRGRQLPAGGRRRAGREGAAAARRTGGETILVGGGVAANGRLQADLRAAAEARGLRSPSRPWPSAPTTPP